VSPFSTGAGNKCFAFVTFFGERLVGCVLEGS
jgi:hypothetical protein